MKPSFILNTYLFCSLLFDIARSRTLWLRSEDSFNDKIAILTTIAVGVKLVLFVLEAVEKRRILKSEYADYPPEATAGFYNRAMFWWLNPLFKAGFNGALRVDDLFTLDKGLSSERLLSRFEEKWTKGNRFRVSSITWFTNSISVNKIFEHSTMGIDQGCEMASGCWYPRQSLRCGLQLLSAFAIREISIFLQLACHPIHKQHRIRSYRCLCVRLRWIGCLDGSIPTPDLSRNYHGARCSRHHAVQESHLSYP